jgi:hypothetical protein
MFFLRGAEPRPKIWKWQKKIYRNLSLPSAKGIIKWSLKDIEILESFSPKRLCTSTTVSLFRKQQFSEKANFFTNKSECTYKLCSAIIYMNEKVYI